MFFCLADWDGRSCWDGWGAWVDICGILYKKCVGLVVVTCPTFFHIECRSVRTFLILWNIFLSDFL